MTQTINNKLNYTHLKIQYIFLKKLFCSHIILTINFQLLFSETLTGFFDRCFVCCVAV